MLEMEDVLKAHGIVGKKEHKPKATIYGFAVDESNSDPSTCVTYIEDAVGMTPASNPSVGNFDGGSWLDVYPFNAIRPVTLTTDSDNLTTDGTVYKELKKDSFGEYIDGTTASDDGYHYYYTMIEIPPIYWNFTKTDNGYEVRWSKTKIDDSYQALAHERGGVLKGNLYIGAYEACTDGTRLFSRSGVSPTVSVSLNDFRTEAKNSGGGADNNGLGLMNFHTLTLLQILFVTMFKSLDSQTALGRGYVGASETASTGITDTEGMYYGNPSDGTYTMKFTGIENLWGNTLSLIDGIIVTYGSVYISDNTIFNDDGTGYAYTFTPSDGFKTTAKYIAGVVGEQIGAFFPSVAGGSSSTYYCDNSLIHQNTNAYAIVSGASKSDTTAGGLFRVNTNRPNASSSTISARLQYLAP